MLLGEEGPGEGFSSGLLVQDAGSQHLVHIMLCVVLHLLSDDSDDSRKSLPSAVIPSVFLTVSMFSSVVSHSASETGARQ